MITLIKQLFRLNRYFLVTYMYKNEDGTTGNGNVSVTVNDGTIFSVINLKNTLNTGGKIESLLILTYTEVNKRDYTIYNNNLRGPQVGDSVKILSIEGTPIGVIYDITKESYWVEFTLVEGNVPLKMEFSYFQLEVVK